VPIVQVLYEQDAEDDTNESVRSVNSLHEEDDSLHEEDDDGQDEWDSPMTDGDEVVANDGTGGEIDDEVELMDYNED